MDDGDLKPKLSKNIKSVLENTDSDEGQGVTALSGKVRDRFSAKKDRRSFINPKSIENSNKKNCSRIQKQFIDTYKERFIQDGK